MHSSTGWLARHAVRLALCGLSGAVIGAGTPPRAVAGTFQAVGSMAEARYDPVVVTLADGSALVIGGWKHTGDNTKGMTSVERFDPKTNQFTSVRPMREPHMAHAAVRLLDGRVMVTGGTTGLQPEDPDIHDAEIFDPVTGGFYSTGIMVALRGNPTLSLLPDGRVLVAGGWTFDETQPSVEIFEPASGRFIPGPNLVIRRYRHCAVTLADGRIVLIGGVRLDGQPIKEVEIYDPQKGAFSPAGSLQEARLNTQAALLSDGRILVAGGIGAAGNLDSVEIYDPATGQSTVAAHFPEPVVGHSLVALGDGQILIAGGLRVSTNEFTPAAPQLADQIPSWLITPGSFQIGPAGPMIQPRDTAGATLLRDGRALIVGGLGFDGSGNYGALASAEVFVP